ncbi:MAG: winged helix-turn-helix domain-containing protein [Proteobacteria bacterium]|jgi:predicted transcriptional regulator|nr:winged helix-turn-helix domain-containing protein [Pseudomonadota bacterium]
MGSVKERSGGLKERRSRMDIIADILSVAGEEAKKTHIVYRANLNFARVDEYLQYMVDKGLIEKKSREYKTTERGEEFLRTYLEMTGRLW